MEEAMVEEMGSPEDDGRVPILIREGYSGRGPHLRRVRRKSKKCGICPLDEEEADFFFRLGQSLDGYCRSMQGPPQSVSLELSAGPPKLLSSKDTELGESGRSWIDCTQEAELECMLFPKNAAQPGSLDHLDHLFGFQGLFGDESLSLLTQDPPQSPALYPGVLTEDSTEQQETQPTSVVGISGTPPDLEGPEVKALPVSGLGLGQGLAAPAEPLDRLSGTSRKQRRPKHVRKRPTMGPVSCAQKPRTDGSSRNLTERGCPGVVS
ncbi:SPOC domain-containing protein 1 [Lemmus lemmus]